MQNTVTNKRRTGLFFLGLFNGKNAQLINGVEISFGTKGPAIVLPSFKETPNRLNLAVLDRNKPARIIETGPEGKKKSKVFNANFRVYGGKFKDAGSVLTMIDAPEGDTRIFIIAAKQWDFEGKLDYFQGIQVKAHAGEPDGSVAPGLMILKDGDAIKFIHEGKTYKLTNLLGEPHLIAELPVIPKKEKSVRKIEEKLVDNRFKVKAPGLTVIAKVELNNKKEVVKPTPVVEATKPPVKKTEVKAKFYKKGAGNNGNHHVPLAKGQTLPEYIPATTGLGELLANALQKNEAVVKTKKVTAVKAEVKKATTKRRTTSAKTKAVA